LLVLTYQGREGREWEIEEGERRGGNDKEGKERQGEGEKKGEVVPYNLTDTPNPEKYPV